MGGADADDSLSGTTGMSERSPFSSRAATRSSSSATCLPSTGTTVMASRGMAMVIGTSISRRPALAGLPTWRGIAMAPGELPNSMALSTIIDTSLLRDRSRKSSRERTLRPGRVTSTVTLCRLSFFCQVGVKPSQ